MPREKPGSKKGKGGRDSASRPGQGLEERALSLLVRLETQGPNPARAAEELDRLQPALERAGQLAPLQERVAALAGAWAEQPIRGEQGDAFLTLVGAFDLKEHRDAVAAVLENGGLPATLRVHAARILPRLGGEAAVRALQAALLSPTDAQVRVAAAEALADLRDRSVRPVLEDLLEEDLPRPVWLAVSTAVDRLR